MAPIKRTDNGLEISKWLQWVMLAAVAASLGVGGSFVAGGGGVHELGISKLEKRVDECDKDLTVAMRRVEIFETYHQRLSEKVDALINTVAEVKESVARIDERMRAQVEYTKYAFRTMTVPVNGSPPSGD